MVNGLEQYDCRCCNIRIGHFCSDDSAIVPFDLFPMAEKSKLLLLDALKRSASGLVRHGQPWIRIPNFTCKSMDSQGANRKLEQKFLAKIGPVLLIFPCPYQLLIPIPVKFMSFFWTQAKCFHKFTHRVFVCLTKACPFYPYYMLPLSRSTPVRGMYDRYPLGWPGGSPAPNLVAWMIPDTVDTPGFWMIMIHVPSFRIPGKSTRIRDLYGFPWK